MKALLVLAMALLFMSGQTALPVAAPPTFSPASATFNAPISVSIATTSAGAIICYTQDGSQPKTDGAKGCAHGTLYPGPAGGIILNTTDRIWAIAGGAGFTDSAAVPSAYTINPPLSKNPSFTFIWTADPLPPAPTVTSHTPAASYATATGVSQDGATWAPLTLAIAGTNLSTPLSCTFDGTAVSCACASATACTVTVPLALSGAPTAQLNHSIVMTFAPFPVLK